MSKCEQQISYYREKSGRVDVYKREYENVDRLEGENLSFALSIAVGAVTGKAPYSREFSGKSGLNLLQIEEAMASNNYVRVFQLIKEIIASVETHTGQVF